MIRPAVLPTVSRGSLVWLPEDAVDAEGIREDLTFPHPLQVKAAQVGRRAPKGTPETIQLYGRRDGLVGVPRHWLWRERSALTRYAARDISAPGRRVCLRFQAQLRPHQQRPALLLRHHDGILEAPCGSGKTVVLLHAIAGIGRLALVLVHTGVLLEQWVERACQFLDLEPDEIGVVGMGSKDVQKGVQKRLWVGLVQSVRRGLPDALRANLGLLVTDEVHHASAPTWMDSILPLPARRRIGATATLERSDGMEFVFLWHIGPVVARMTAPRLEPTIWIHRTGIAPDPEAIAGKVDWREVGQVYEEAGGEIGDAGWEALKEHARGERDRDSAVDTLSYTVGYGVAQTLCRKVTDVNWAKLGTVLSEDEERDEIITGYIREAFALDRCVLVLTDRVKHAIRLAGALGDLGPSEVGCCIGSLKAEYAALAEELMVEVSPSGVSKPRRERRADHMGRQVIVATADLVKEGFDKPELDTLVDAGIYADRTRAVQTVGRILRPCEGKADPVVVFFLDDDDLCEGTMRKRLRALYREDYDVRDVVEGRGPFDPG